MIEESARKGFLAVSSEWGLTPEQVELLKDSMDGDDIYGYGLIIGIYGQLHIQFGDNLADRWVRLPNNGYLFTGQAPIEYMINNGIEGMKRVHNWFN